MVNIREAKTVFEEPEAILEHWSIIRTRDRGELHFVGILDAQKARITSPVADFDLATMTGTTSSGRRYTLRGEAEQGTKLVSKIVEVFGQRSTDWAGITFDQVEVVEPSVAAMASPALGSA
ncbi:hypothetical protein [Pseudorhizobium flavum]|uniref:hypothetical protein n=1 Tax=Pseudorhizobium flavum TaxID=1335061 RepID=UPI00376FABDF